MDSIRFSYSAFQKITLSSINNNQTSKSDYLEKQTREITRLIKKIMSSHKKAGRQALSDALKIIPLNASRLTIIRLVTTSMVFLGVRYTYNQLVALPDSTLRNNLLQTAIIIDHHSFYSYFQDKRRLAWQTILNSEYLKSHHLSNLYRFFPRTKKLIIQKAMQLASTDTKDNVELLINLADDKKFFSKREIHKMLNVVLGMESCPTSSLMKIARQHPSLRREAGILALDRSDLQIGDLALLLSYEDTRDLAELTMKLNNHQLPV